MNERTINFGHAMFDTVHDRLRAMSLPSWRCDTAGAMIIEPVEPGLAGLWLRSGRVTALVSAAAKEWSVQSALHARQVFDGCWLIPVQHEQRRRRIGLTIGMALGPAALAGPVFAEACAAAGLDEHAARLTLRKLAVFDEAGVMRTTSLLQWMVNDLAATTEHAATVHGFTHELTQSFETIDVLYALGRSMLDLRNPDRFTTLVCDRLHDTLPFGYLAFRFVDDERIVGPLAGRLLTRGALPASNTHIEETLRRLCSRPAGDIRGHLAKDESATESPDARVLVQPVMLDGKLAAVLVCGDKHGEDPQVNSYDMQLIEAAAGYTGAFLENARLVRDQQAMFMGTLRALTAAIDAKDRYTCGHSERVAQLAAQLAAAAGLDANEVERVHICGLVHDVGKIGVPEAILCKPGRLTEEELTMIKLHPEIGFRILKDIPMLENVLPGVLHHHERFAGGGYPTGIKGLDIPLAARLICLADTFDAMSSNRAYRPAMPRDKVLAEIRRCAGSQFDPDLAATFVTLDFASYDAMVARHALEYGSQKLIAA